LGNAGCRKKEDRQTVAAALSRLARFAISLAERVTYGALRLP
jgi:hypothetical protein